MDELEILEGVLDKYTFFSYHGVKKPLMYYHIYDNRHYSFQKAQRTLISLFEYNRIFALPKETCTADAINNLMQIKKSYPELGRQMFRGLELECVMDDVLKKLKEL